MCRLVMFVAYCAICLPLVANAKQFTTRSISAPMVIDPGERRTSVVAFRKITNATTNKVGKESSPYGDRNVVVVFDATKIRRDAAQLRRRLGLKYDDEYVRRVKKAGYLQLLRKLENELAKTRLEVVADYPNLPVALVRINTSMDFSWLKSLPFVAYVYEDLLNSLHLLVSLPQIRQPVAQYYGHTGAGTAVAVLDTGAALDNPAFGDCSSLGGACRIVFAEDFTETDDGADDDNDHGTHVAGIVAAVAPDTDILALDVFEVNDEGDHGAPSSALIDAIDFVLETQQNFGTVAINMSLGREASGTCDHPVQPALLEAREAGIATIISSGNDGDPQQISAPACLEEAISVGAVNALDMVADFSNSGQALDLLAPGFLIVSAGIPMGGTSMAAPHVAGAWAVMRSSLPERSLEETLTTLQDKGRPVTDYRQDRTSPRLDLAAALDLAPSFGDLDGAVECQIKEVTDPLECGWETVTGTVECGVEIITDPLEILATCGCQGWSCSCEIPATCQIPATCDIVVCDN